MKLLVLVATIIIASSCAGPIASEADTAGAAATPAVLEGTNAHASEEAGSSSTSPAVEAGAARIELPTCEDVFADTPADKRELAVRLHFGQWIASIEEDTLYGVPVSFTEEQKVSIREQLELRLVDGKLCGLVELDGSWRE